MKGRLETEEIIIHYNALICFLKRKGNIDYGYSLTSFFWDYMSLEHFGEKFWYFIFTLKYSDPQPQVRIH